MKKKFMLPKPAKGQSLVELAISLVVLLFLLSGAVEFGILFFQFVQLRDAAQEGALYGSASFSLKTNPPELTTVETRARSASSSPVNLADTSKVHVSIYIVDTSNNETLVWQDGSSQNTISIACEGNGLKVTVSYHHIMFMPFLSGRDIPLSATVTDTILKPVCT